MEMMVGTDGETTRTVVLVSWIIILIDFALTVTVHKLVDDAFFGCCDFSLRRDVNDLFMVALLRAFLLPGLSLMAYVLWWRSVDEKSSGPRTRLEDDYVPLVEHESLTKRKTRADFRRDVLLALLFVSASACQAFVGVKMCLYNFDPGQTKLLAALMGCTAALIPVEAWLLSNVVQLRTKLLTSELPQIHRHPLAYSPAGNNWCDKCDRRILDAYMWRCDRCNFDLCLACYSRAVHSDQPQQQPERETTTSLTPRAVPVESPSAPSSQSNEVPPPPSTRLPDESEISTSEILRQTARLLAPDWPYIVVALSCVCASGAASLAIPNLQGRIIDSVYQKDRNAFRTRLLQYLAFSVGAAVTSALRAMCFQTTGRRLSCTLRNRLFASIVRQDVSFFDNNASGTLTSRLTQDINQMSMPLTTLLGTLTSALIQLSGSVAMAFYTSWRLSMLAFTTIGPIMHITSAYATWSKEQNRKILTHLGEANAVATEALGNIRTVKSMGADGDEIERYMSHTIAARDRGVVDAALSASTQLINNFLDRGAGWLILFYGGTLAMRDGSGLSAGRLVTYQLYFNNIQSSYSTLISLLSSFTRASGAAQRVLGMLGALPIVDPDSGTRLTRPPTGALSFDNVHFAYEARPDRLVLRGFTLDVKAGSTVALVGKSGSGKTTALHLALRFYDAQLGTVRLDGTPLSELNARDFRSYCSIVAQSTELFDTTISSNIKYGAQEDVSDQEVVDAAVAALAHEFIVDFPNEYETRVGERGVKISGGQRQRLSIARAFLRKPRILFLDEATSALDSESEAKVQQSLDALISRGSCTVLLVAHRLSTVRNADAIAVLADGAIVELGNHEQLMNKNDGIYAMLVKRQLEKSANAIEDSHVDSAATEVDRLLALSNKAKE